MVKIKQTKKTKRTIKPENPRQGKTKKKVWHMCHFVDKIDFSKLRTSKRQVTIAGYLNLTLFTVVNENLDLLRQS